MRRHHVNQVGIRIKTAPLLFVPGHGVGPIQFGNPLKSYREEFAFLRKNQVSEEMRFIKDAHIGSKVAEWCEDRERRTFSSELLGISVAVNASYRVSTIKAEKSLQYFDFEFIGASESNVMIFLENYFPEKEFFKDLRHPIEISFIESKYDDMLITLDKGFVSMVDVTRSSLRPMHGIKKS
jgi:hypothetical protein